MYTTTYYTDQDGCDISQGNQTPEPTSSLPEQGQEATPQPGWEHQELTPEVTPIQATLGAEFYRNPLLQEEELTELGSILQHIPPPLQSPDGTVLQPPSPGLTDAKGMLTLDDNQDAGALFGVNQRIFGALGTMSTTPVTCLVGCVRVDVSDPEFHYFYKKPYTVQQALAVIERKDSTSVSTFTEGIKNSGPKAMQVVELFLNHLIAGYRLSLKLTVSLIPLAITRAKGHPKAQLVQDITQAWLNARDDQLCDLLKALKQGVIPSALLLDKALIETPGQKRLADEKNSSSAFKCYYEHLMAMMAYSSTGSMEYLKTIAAWSATFEYKQKEGEQLIHAISRERNRWLGLIQGCQRDLAESEVPTARSRILNFSTVVLKVIFKPTEQRQLLLKDGKPLLQMNLEQVQTECLAEEKRQGDLTISDIVAAGKPTGKSFASERPERPPRGERRQIAEDKDASKGPKKQKSERRVATTGSPSTGERLVCANHPESTAHTTENCKAATPEGYCLKHIRSFCKLSAADCRHKHKAPADYTPAERKDAADKAPKHLQDNQHRAAPTVVNDPDTTKEGGWATEQFRDEDAIRLYAAVVEPSTPETTPPPVTAPGAPQRLPPPLLLPEPKKSRTQSDKGSKPAQKVGAAALQKLQSSRFPARKRVNATPPAENSLQNGDKATNNVCAPRHNIDMAKYVKALETQLQVARAEQAHLRAEYDTQQGVLIQGSEKDGILALQNVCLRYTSQAGAEREAIQAVKEGAAISMIEHKGAMIMVRRDRCAPVHQVGPHGLGQLNPGTMYTTGAEVIAITKKDPNRGMQPPAPMANRQFPYTIVHMRARFNADGTDINLIGSPSYDNCRWVNCAGGAFPFRSDLKLLGVFWPIMEQVPVAVQAWLNEAMPPCEHPGLEDADFLMEAPPGIDEESLNKQAAAALSAEHDKQNEELWDAMVSDPNAQVLEWGDEDDTEDWLSQIDTLDLGDVASSGTIPAYDDVERHLARVLPPHARTVTQIQAVNAAHVSMHATAVQSAGRQDGNHKGSNDVDSLAGPAKELDAFVLLMGAGVSPSGIARATKARKRLREAACEVRDLMAECGGGFPPTLATPVKRCRQKPTRYVPTEVPSDDTTDSDSDTGCDSSSDESSTSSEPSGDLVYDLNSGTTRWTGTWIDDDTASDDDDSGSDNSMPGLECVCDSAQSAHRRTHKCIVRHGQKDFIRTPKHLPIPLLNDLEVQIGDTIGLVCPYSNMGQHGGSHFEVGAWRCWECKSCQKFIDIAERCWYTNTTDCGIIDPHLTTVASECLQQSRQSAQQSSSSQECSMYIEQGAASESWKLKHHEGNPIPAQSEEQWNCHACTATNSSEFPNSARCELCSEPRQAHIRPLTLSNDRATAVKVLAKWLSTFPEMRARSRLVWEVVSKQQGDMIRIANTWDTDTYMTNDMLRMLSTCSMTTYALICYEMNEGNDDWTTLPRWSCGSALCPSGAAPAHRLIAPTDQVMKTASHMNPLCTMGASVEKSCCNSDGTQHCPTCKACPRCCQHECSHCGLTALACWPFCAQCTTQSAARQTQTLEVACETVTCSECCLTNGYHSVASDIEGAFFHLSIDEASSCQSSTFPLIFNMDDCDSSEDEPECLQVYAFRTSREEYTDSDGEVTIRADHTQQRQHSTDSDTPRRHSPSAVGSAPRSRQERRHANASREAAKASRATMYDSVENTPERRSTAYPQVTDDETEFDVRRSVSPQQSSREHNEAQRAQTNRDPNWRIVRDSGNVHHSGRITTTESITNAQNRSPPRVARSMEQVVPRSIPSPMTLRNITRPAQEGHSRQHKMRADDLDPNSIDYNNVFVVNGSMSKHKAHIYRECRWIALKKVLTMHIGDRELCSTCVQKWTKKHGLAPTKAQKPKRNNKTIKGITEQLRQLELDGAVDFKVELSIRAQTPQHTSEIVKLITDVRSDHAAHGNNPEHCVIAPTVRGKAPKVQLHGMIAFLVTDGNSPKVPIIVVPDTAAEATVITASLAQSTWETASNRIDSVAGVGGDSTLKQKTSVPLQFRYGSKTVRMLAYPAESALNELRGAHMIIGLKEMGLLRMKFNASDRSVQMTIGDEAITVILEPVTVLKQRLESRGLNVITFCNGGEFIQAPIRDLGWQIASWEAHDTDEKAREIATAVFPDIAHPSPQDVLKLPLEYLANRKEPVDLVILTSECVSFSRAKVNPPPLGFDDTRAKPLAHVSGMIHNGYKANKVIYFASEQVQVHPALKGCEAEQDALIGANEHGFGYTPDEAADSGSPSSRVRRFAQNICDIKQLPVRQFINPDSILNEGCKAKRSPLPCLVSSDATHSPALVYDPTIRDIRPLSEEEREAAMGYPRGITNAFGAVKVTPKKRRQLMGAALNYWQMAAIFREMKPPLPTVHLVAAPVMLGADPDNLEALFLPMTLEQVKVWVGKRFTEIGFVLPQLKITLKDPEMLPYQSKQRMTVQAGLIASAEDWVRSALEAGIIRKAQYSHDMWISAQFFKEKPGRTNEYGNPEVRPLVNAKILTDACEHPMFWLESMPTVVGAGAMIPANSRSFVEIDIEGFYNLLGVHPGSYKYQGVWILGELYIYLVCIQGSGPAAAWANYVLEYLYNAALGRAWETFTVKFVDDHLCFGKDDAQALNRAKILRAVLEVGGLKVSAKTPGIAKSSGQLAGITVTKDGIALNQEAIDALNIALDTTPKTVTAIKSMIGVILYTHTAFKWDISDLAWFAKTLSPLHHAATLKPIVWSDECKASVKALRLKTEHSPRWFTHFKDLITDDTCLCIMTDASDTGGGAALFLVQLPCATMIVPMVHLTDPNMARLLSTRSKVFSSTDCNRPTFEQEFKMAVFGIKTWGNLITTLTVNYPPGKGRPAKIGCFTDSSVTASKLGGGDEGRQRSFVYELPVEPIDYLSARAKSFLEMRDSIAYSRYWPMVVRFTQGVTNSLADLLSRAADLLKDLADKHEAADQRTKKVTWTDKNMVANKADTAILHTACPMILQFESNMDHQHDETVVVAPVRLHTYHDAPPEDGIIEGEAPPLPLKGLALTRIDISAMQTAYASDHTMYHKVKISEIYMACTQGVAGLHPSVASKVKPWLNKRFYAKDGILYTQASYIKFRDQQDEGEAPEDRATLAGFMVPVIPANAKVQISESDCSQADQACDLREDIMLIAHDFRLHAALGDMQAQVRLIGWWPSVLADCKYHVRTCAICLQHRHCLQPAGLSTQAWDRLSVLQFDHCVLEPAVQAATGYWAILTMVDVGSGQMALAAAVDKTARCTAYLLFITWIRVYGIPRILQSDSDAGYRSEVMKLVCGYLGIKVHDTSARAQKGTAAKAERANAYVRRMERIMTANGQVSASHLHMYMAAVEITANQQNEWLGHSSHERLFAQRPVTVVDLIAPGAFPEVNTSDTHLASDDAAWIKFFASRAKDMHMQRFESADERARNVSLDRDMTVDASTSTIFDLRPGDKVSYGGESYLLEQLHGPPGEPITAVIRMGDNQTRKVRYATLRPLATARPLIRLPFITPCDTGAFLIYEAGDELVAFGKVISQDQQDIRVHVYESNSQGSRWHALYELTDGSIKPFTSMKQPPADATPHVDTTKADAVLAMGEISVSGALSKELHEARRAIGIN